ncbi:MAG: hypothetical protein CLLPBCKN_001517 [Chroococcidiopsis cubana SAG 39.79]|uniref:DUF3104 domain-containing protein n=1 Tax=Chroococcidiopsis cubana SAG 39.79 TaxID=388085 RepID=A0AB37U8W5_9CYAN|nr:hypothetical protein [Chroococcidiopsis cubana]MDZ4872129.1 hypothetical protein [Chroococcidiopsis cubana SAG 39.79]PSB64276.1 hypothetical protein C7B79_10425 [Chroococcidiopsis cubana CCALA 043]RUT00721.1 hypothetical protein DSM107010_66950 [Chroococcidiopsis cubana SAG 39.79]
MSNAVNHKRVMLANLKIGQCISFPVKEQRQPFWVTAEIIDIQIKGNCGQIWTRFGSLPKEPLTSKYKVIDECS